MTMEARTIKRREFVGSLAAGAAAMAFPHIVTASAKSRPNVLVIMSDEHDPAVSGCYGDPIAQTPNLDRLAQSGVVFDSCYTNSPLCVPSRLSFTSGKYSSRVGAWNNDCWLPADDYPSLPRIMNAAGCESFLAGKMHYDPTRRYGFTELYPASTNQSQKTGRGGRRQSDDESVNHESWKNRSSDFRVGDSSNVINHDLLVTQNCVEFLSRRRKDDKPFFLLAGYLSPHFPLIVPEKYASRYAEKIAMPDIPAGHLDNLPLNYKHLRMGFGVVDATPQQVKMGRELYWGFVNWFDDQLGQLLTALEHSGLAQNTLVVYTADHGENKGDHGLWWKNCMYQAAARVPLVVRWPERWRGGQRRAGVCSLVDAVQTIADIGGAEVPEDWNGNSLAPWMDNPQTKWKDCAVSEYYAHNIASGFTMLRQGNCKYVYHCRMDENRGPERELYDLQADPKEFHNLAAQPGRQKQMDEMHRLLIKEIGRDPEETEQICRADCARGYAR
ncbi:MAG: sulfatase-like hydrolase/transferase [Candidatus Omnitrophota bacterium]